MKYLFAALLALTSASVYAQEASGPYMGFSVGSFDYEESDEDLGFSFSDSTSAYRLFGGYRFSENFSLEGGWTATSDLEESVAVPGIGNFGLNVDFEALTVRALGRMPFDKVALFGGIGYYDADMTASASLTGLGTLAAVEDSDSGATLIGGFEVGFKRLSLRGEYEWFDTDSSVDASAFSVGLQFNF